MSIKLKVAVLAAAIATGCSQERPSGEDASARDTARNAAAPHDMSNMPAESDTTGTAGMDHSAMSSGRTEGMTHRMPAAGEMPGMDHSQMRTANAPSGSMAGMDHSAMMQRSANSQSMAGMDHSQMNMPSAQRSAPNRSATGMQNHNMSMGNQQPARDPHAGMTMTPGISAQPAPPDPHAGMQMDEPGEPPLPDDVAMEKLRALVAELVRDPDVQARIQADPTMRTLWQDAGVRQYLLKRP